MAEIKSVKSVAAEIGVEPKALRRFLRAQLRSKGVETPGKGRQYDLSAFDADKIADAYADWQRNGNGGGFVAVSPDLFDSADDSDE